jgi:hypothetical protein
MWAETVMPGVEIPLPPEPDDDGPPPPTPLRRNGSQRGRADLTAGAAVLDLGAAVDGARFILDAPPQVAPIWGEGSRVLWASGEALMIAGPQGLGKTTLAGLLVKALLGAHGDVLGMPVTESCGRVLYLAMDRPSQIARSLRRQFTEADRERLADRLIVRPGPPPADLAGNPYLLAAMVEHYRAAVVIVDSLKDAAVGLSDDAVGAGYNRARQHVLAAGCEVCELHHTVKRGAAGGPPTTVADIYGSTWLTSGAGSVVLLSGDPGDPIVGMRHVKQPAEEVGPYRLLHDQTAGLLTVEHAADLVAMVNACRPEGLTAREAAVALTDKTQPSRADIEKARRKLDALVASGLLTRLDGARGTGDKRAASIYFPPAGDYHGQSRSEAKPEVRDYHGNFAYESTRDPHPAITPEHNTAGQDYHASNHGRHGAANHVSPPLL